jgi:hypothetical protein
MEQETEEICSDAGLTFSWLWGPDDVAAEIGPLVSVQFHGKCRLEQGAEPLPARGPIA